jgi:RNA polymerase sigma factor (sigma-70 family)
MTNNLEIENVFKKEKSGLFNFIRSRVLLKEDAEDILNDVFLRFIENIPEIEIVENLTSWLFTIARNRITDKYRKKKPDIFSDIEIIKSDDDDSLNLSDIIADTRNLPDKELIINELWEEVEEALDELPDEQKEVFILNEFEGYSFKEISEMLDVPVNTLLSRKRYSVLYLRKKLQKLYKEIKNVS